MVDCHFHYSVMSPLCVPSKLEDYMGDQVTHVLTHQTWDKNFEEALEDNARLSFVNPRWIFACHAKQKLVPHQAFLIVPSSQN